MSSKKSIFELFSKKSSQEKVHQLLLKVENHKRKVSRKDFLEIWEKYHQSTKQNKNFESLPYETAILFLQDCNKTFGLGYSQKDIEEIFQFSWEIHESKIYSGEKTQISSIDKVLHFPAFAQLFFEVALDARFQLTQSLQMLSDKILPPTPLWRSPYDMLNSEEPLSSVLLRSSQNEELLKNPENQKFYKNRVVHIGFSCNNCQNIIVGNRYHCLQCGNYDLCSLCFHEKKEEIDNAEWSVHQTKEGHTFYWNTVAGFSQWDPPHRSNHYIRCFKQAIPTSALGGGIFEKDTVWETLQVALQAFPDRQLFGWRSTVENTLNPNNFDFLKDNQSNNNQNDNNEKNEKNLRLKIKKPESPENSDEEIEEKQEEREKEYSWMTFSQVLKFIEFLGSGLSSIFQARTFICISGINRPEWIISDLACCRQNFITIPIDTKMDNIAVKHILKTTKSSAIICSSDLLEKFLTCFKEQKEENDPINLTHFICFENEISNDLNKSILKENLKLLTLKELVLIGEKNRVPPNPQKKDELFTLCYTSGSTGLPKGAIFNNLTYKNRMCIQYTMPNPLVTLSYCSFAHMMDRQMAHLTILYGGKLGIYSGDLRRIFDDFRSVRPSMISTTPHLYNELYSEYKEDLLKLKKKLKNLNFEKESDYEKEFKKEKEKLLRKSCLKLGGYIESVTTGGAATSEKVMQFLKEAFKCHFSHGYAATETGGIYSFGYGPNQRVKIKLIDVPEMGYFVKDTPSRGEILIKSENAIQGYFQNEKATKEQFDEEGYWHSGDIGEVNSKGEYSIIDRKKSIFKNSLGEFIAPDKVERNLLESKFVHQIFIYGSSLYPYVVAIVIPSENQLFQTAKENNLQDKTSEKLCKNSLINKIILADIRRTGIQQKLLNHEIPRMIYLSSKEFSKEAGQLTTTMKIKRPALEQSFKKEIQEMYSNNEQNEEETIDLSDDIELSTEDRLAFALKKRMKLDILDNQSRTSPLSLDSLQIVRVIRIINEMFHIEIPLQILMKDPSLKDLSEFIDSSHNPDKIRNLFNEKEKILRLIKKDMDIEIKFDKDIYTKKQNSPDVENPKNILLTGATGFIGIFLLEELLKKTKTNIYCLIRGKEGNIKLKNLAKGAGFEIDENRVKTLEIDLSSEFLQKLKPLEDIIDTIFHCGAFINSLMSYNQVRNSNTLATVQLLEFSMKKREKIFHFISTMGIWGGLGSFKKENSDITEHFDHLLNLNGYSQSKWVAEYLIFKTKKLNSNFKFTIHRPSMVCSHSKTGYANPNDFFNRILISFIQLGKAIDSNGIYDITPVDCVANTIIKISLNKSNLTKAFHYANYSNSLSMKQLAQNIKEYGFNLEIVPYHEFLKEKEEDFKNNNNSNEKKQNALEVLRPYFTKNGWNPDHGKISTENMLKAANISSPPKIDKNHIFLLLDHLVKIGFVSK